MIEMEGEQGSGKRPTRNGNHLPFIHQKMSTNFCAHFLVLREHMHPFYDIVKL